MIWMVWLRGWRYGQDREDVQSADGKVTFNWLQQREPDTSERPLSPLEEIGTTDPWGVTGG